MRIPGYKFWLVALAFVFSMFVANSFAESTKFSSVVPEQKLVFPHDYGAHPDFRLEWWYATGWLETPDGNPLGFQITFFRTATGKNHDNPSRFAAKQLIVAHVALSDPSVGKLLHDEKTVREGFDLAYAKEGDTDVRLDDWYLVREADGRYEVDMQARDFGLKLTFTPTQMMMRQGDDGFSRKGPKPAQASYYYSEPHLQVTGIVTRDNRPMTVNGSAWLDHEWSSEILDPDAVGWDWVGANLDDGSALMAFQIRHKDGGKLWAYGTLRDAAGHVTQFIPEQVEFTPLRTWQSPHTDAYYPVEMHLRAGDVEWQLIPLFDDQELDSRQSIGSAYWEGAVTLMRKGQPVGRGYLELTGYVEPLDM